MPPAGRVGDRSQVPADSHGCPACPHSAAGPAVAGSLDVFINSRAALRVGDPGVHSACCGPNSWKASAGAPGVIINGKPAHRQDDAVVHCGGQGQLIEGSPDVIIGNEVFWAAVAAVAPEMLYDEAFVLVDEKNGTPLANRRYQIIRENGEIIEGVTDDEGHTVLVESTYPEKLRLEIPAQEINRDLAEDEEEAFRIQVVTPEGKPFSGHQATITQAGSRFEVTLDEQGVAWVVGLDPGLPCDVLVSDHGYLAVRGAVEWSNSQDDLPAYDPGQCGEDLDGC